MKGIQSILFQSNQTVFLLQLGDKNTITYQDVVREIDSSTLSPYLESLLDTTFTWDPCYVDLNVPEGDHWKVVITYLDHTRKEFLGRSLFPFNFDSFRGLIYQLIGEVM